MEREKIVQMAVDLAWALWRGMDATYKRRYARVIWDQFQSRLQGEAMATSNLGTFVNSACSKLGVTALGKADELPALDAILQSGEDRAILRVMREETALVVVRVRLLNEQRRAEFEERVDEVTEEEALIKAQEEGSDGIPQ